MSGANASNASGPAHGSRGRFCNRRLRRASFILPSTGERSTRAFTLREALDRSASLDSGEATPLLNGNASHDATPYRDAKGSLWQHYWEGCASKASQARDFAFSKTGLGILKCSLAYFLASLVTFVPALANLIGKRQDSKHMVATVTVWFHPARTIGSMHEATILAFIALCYSGVVSFGSMAISMFFRDHDLLTVGHAIVLVVFIGGGLGLVAWVKQRLGHPLVNVACSLASLGCITVLIKEGAVQAGAFSLNRVLQVLLMVLMGIIIVTAVNGLVLPSTARGSLVKELEKNTDLLGEMLVGITRAFLSGRKSDLEDEPYKKLLEDLQKSGGNLSKNLGEAKRELWLLGKERQYGLEAKLVDCLTGLTQDLGGLRSAAFAQFAFIDEALEDTIGAKTNGKPVPNGDVRPSVLDSIIEDSEDASVYSPQPNGTPTPPAVFSGDTTPDRRPSADMPISFESPGDMFLAFIDQLGPPTKSLVYTLKQILDELPWREKSSRSLWAQYADIPNVEVAMNDNFQTSLKTAMELYRQSRNEALQRLYTSRAMNAAGISWQGGGRTTKPFAANHNGSVRGPRAGRDPEAVLADIEEVSACCGHFSFSLLDFAEDISTYLDILADLKKEIDYPHHSWGWLWSWFKRSDGDREEILHGRVSYQGNNGEDDHTAHDIPNYIREADNFIAQPADSRSWSYRFVRSLFIFGRDDVHFAIKVGLGALIFALPAFIHETRPTFVHWRGEWGLVSYMAVCSMTVGASNTTSINRFIGTVIGALLAILAWVLAADHGDANPYTLAFFGWLMSVGCFYIIIARNNGPMGRFVLLTYNLGALYSYSLMVMDDDNDDDERQGGIDPAIWSIMLHRVVAVIAGCVWAIIITRFIWPISARKKLKQGLCILWLRMALVWKRDPLALFLLGSPRSSYMDIREESSLHAYLSSLQGLRKAAVSEYELRGPFPDETIGRILERTGRMLDAFHAMNVVITKNLQYTPGEAAVLRFTRAERFELSARISHLFSVLASSVKLEYPMNDVLPSIDHTRDRLLARISEFRTRGEGREQVLEQDYELLYAYGEWGNRLRTMASEHRTDNVLQSSSLASSRTIFKWSLRRSKSCTAYLMKITSSCNS